MTYKIDKGIPIPTPHNRHPSGQERMDRKLDRWAFAEVMEVGDSVALKTDSERAGFRRYLLEVRGFKWELKSKSIDGGIRIWRVK